MEAPEMFSQPDCINILSTFAPFVTVCLGNEGPAGKFGNTQGDVRLQHGWWGGNLLRVKQHMLEW